MHSKFQHHLFIIIATHRKEIASLTFSGRQKISPDGEKGIEQIVLVFHWLFRTVLQPKKATRSAKSKTTSLDENSTILQGTKKQKDCAVRESNPSLEHVIYPF